MKTRNILSAMLAVGTVWLPARTPAEGTWTQLVQPAPGMITMVLLSDGTEMAQRYGGNGTTTWYKLTPDSRGRYANGTWSTRSSMHDSRLYCATVGLRDGRLFVAGGEYGTGGGTAEIYDPLTDGWTRVNPPASLLDPTQNQSFADSSSKILPDGRVLIYPVNPGPNGTLIYDPVASTWSGGPTPVDNREASWVKLPDDSILVIDADVSPTGGQASQRYLPSTGTGSWVTDGVVPVDLYAHLAGFYGEIGPGLLLPNGKVIYMGGNGSTALYTPSGTTSPGTWANGPSLPAGLGMADAAGAMMVNGKALCVVGPQPASDGTDVTFPTPTSFFEYDPVANAFTQIHTPFGGTTVNFQAFPCRLLDLPDGTVLFSSPVLNYLFVYQPDGLPLTAGKPMVQMVSTNGDGSLHLTGTLFNGISEGASYGDDAQMDSNYPLVRFTDASGNVRYGRSYNWSRTSVATGSAVVTTECTVPAGASLQDTIQVVANGIASDGISLIVSTTADNGAGSLRQVVNFLPAGSVVTFAPNLSGQTITLTSGEIALNKNLEIDGSNLASGIRINGNHNSRIFNVSGGVTVVMNSLIITNGYAGTGNWGGAILNSGALTLNHCTLVGNSVDANAVGGAILNSGALTLMSCTLSSNAAGFAGAINNDSSCTLQNCTFFGNVATPGNGGAIDNVFGAMLSVLHCTFSGNSAAGAGGGIDNYLSQVNITNTIIAVNNGLDIYNWSASTVILGGANIVQSSVNAGGTNLGAAAITSAPLLAPPGNYGGPTPTLPPLPGSPAIDAGVPTGLTTDQRGFPRPIGLAPDIGAVEGVYSPAGPGVLTGLTQPGGGSFQLAFTNSTDMSFTVLASTNLTLPLTLWSNLGAAVESPAGSGQYQFTDPQATNNPHRFYRVRSP